MAFDEVKTIYLFIVKMCHPDTGTVGTSHQREEWMKRANLAKSTNNVAELKRIIAESMGGTTSSANTENRSANTNQSHSSGRSSRTASDANTGRQQQEERTRRQEQVRREQEARRQEQARRAAQQEAEDRARIEELARKRRLAEEQRARERQEEIERAHLEAERQAAMARKKGKERKIFIVAVLVLFCIAMVRTLIGSIDVASSPDLPMATLSTKPQLPRKYKLTPTSDQQNTKKYLKVETSIGMGAYLRNSASWNDKGIILQEGKKLEVIREGIRGDGTVWYYVRVVDSGDTGYIPVELVETV